MNKKLFLASILVTGILVAGVMVGQVAAQTDGQVVPEISYPVTELGNCADKTACRTYCDKSENIDACLIFAGKNKMMSDEEIKTAKNFKKSGMIGPGGCKGKDECKAYCNGPEHMDECIAFAEKNGMMSGKQLEEAKKVKSALAKGIKPPACGGKEACDAYCSSPEHIEECVKFGEDAGMISREDAEKIRQGGGKGKGQGQNGQGGRDGDRQGPGGGKQGPEGQDDRQGPGGQQNGPEGGNSQGKDKQGPGPGRGQGKGGGGKGNGGKGGQGGQGGGR